MSTRGVTLGNAGRVVPAVGRCVANQSPTPSESEPVGASQADAHSRWRWCRCRRSPPVPVAAPDVRHPPGCAARIRAAIREWAGDGLQPRSGLFCRSQRHAQRRSARQRQRTDTPRSYRLAAGDAAIRPIPAVGCGGGSGWPTLYRGPASVRRRQGVALDDAGHRRAGIPVGAVRHARVRHARGVQTIVRGLSATRVVVARLAGDDFAGVADAAGRLLACAPGLAGGAPVAAIREQCGRWTATVRLRVDLSTPDLAEAMDRRRSHPRRAGARLARVLGCAADAGSRATNRS